MLAGHCGNDFLEHYGAAPGDPRASHKARRCAHLLNDSRRSVLASGVKTPGQGSAAAESANTVGRVRGETSRNAPKEVTMSSTTNTHQHDHRSDDETCRRSVVRAVRVVSPNLWVLAIRDVDTELPKRAVAAALVLRSYMNQTATCWPAVATISGGMRASDRTVQRALSQLEASGWLLRTPQGHHKGSKYQAALPRDPKLLARLRGQISIRKDAAVLLGHLPISDAEVTPVTPLHDPDVAPLSPLNPSGVTSATSEVTPVSHKDPMNVYTPPPSPPTATASVGMGGSNPSIRPPAGWSATEPCLEDERRPEDLTDQQWAAWQADPLRPTGCSIYQWACFRRNIVGLGP